MKLAIIALVISSVSMFGQDVSVVHAPSSNQIGTVTIWKHYRYHKTETTYFVSQSVGFSTQECDFVVPFSTVEVYESEETHPDSSKTMEVTLNGETYNAVLRSHGYYPLGLDLACLDLLPNVNGPAKLFPLVVQNVTPEHVTTHDESLSISKTVGLPLLNDKNEVVGILVRDDTVVWGHDIRRFLNLVVDDSPKSWPILRQR